MPQLSILIVNYYSAAVLKPCLDSIVQGTHNLDYELLVVNNSLDDKEFEGLKPVFRRVKWLEAGYNAGFARANNMGIRKAGGTFVLLLNSDTVVPSGTLEYVVSWMEQHPEFAAIGTPLEYPEGTPQISGNYALKGGLNYLMMIPFLGKLLKYAGQGMGVQKTNIDAVAKEVQEVDWINGAFLLVRKSAILQAGMLDEDFFLYHEESEWCSRLKKTGKLGILGKYKVVHLEGFSSNKAFQSQSSGHNQLFDKKGRQLFVSLMLRIRKEFGLGWFCFHLIAFTGTLPVVLLLGAINSLTGAVSFKPYLAYTLNIASIWPLVPKIISGAPHFYKVL